MNTSMLRHAISGMAGTLFWALISSTLYATDVPLSPGNPVTIGTPSEFSGVGGTNSSGGAVTAMNAFAAAIGGANNGGNPPPQANGFRAINWDGVLLDGTDFGGISIIISPNHVVGIPLNRFQERGVFFDEIYAVSGPASATDPSTFTTVNPNVANLFPAFSPTKTFAMFNDNGIGFRFVLASAHTASQEFAATRGFGAIFRNVVLANTTSIEYFNGARSLGKFFVPIAPIGSLGQAEFLGVLFANPIVTSVQITCGTDALFSFDGTTISSSSSNNPPGGHNLVVTDDFVYAEPVVATNAQPAIAATAGSSFNGLVATFSDLDPTGNVRSFTATIDWGDGHFSQGTIVANTSGGFNVTGANTYSAGGTLPVTVKIADLEGEALTIRNRAAVTGAGQLLNISTRGRVETDANVLIGGFIIGSTSGTTRAVLRGIGPSLTAVGVPGALQDPTLELHDASGALLAMNDNWKDTQQVEIEATGLAPTNDLESAILTSLVPGPYTVILRGKNNTVGVGLVEAYNLQ
jgi:hypothetical protein